MRRHAVLVRLRHSLIRAGLTLVMAAAPAGAKQTVDVSVDLLEEGYFAEQLGHPQHWVVESPAHLAQLPDLPFETAAVERTEPLHAGQVLVLVAAGERASGGYRVELAPDLTRRHLLLRCELDTPPPGVAAIQVITQPWELYAVRPPLSRALIVHDSASGPLNR